LSATICAVALLLEGGLGMAMDVAADGGELGRGTGKEIGRERVMVVLRVRPAD
jgi:hypothetical protein